MYNPAEGYVRTVHSVRGLPRVVCHITGHNAEGKSVFLSTDGGDHHHELVSQSAIANIIYSTNQHPVELNGDVGINYTHENEVRTPQLLMPSTQHNRTKSKHSPRAP